MDHWEKSHERGKNLYVYEQTLRFSIPCAFGFPLLGLLFFPGSFNIMVLYFESFIFLAIGFILGYLRWMINEYQYQQYLLAVPPKTP